MKIPIKSIGFGNSTFSEVEATASPFSAMTIVPEVFLIGNGNSIEISLTWFYVFIYISQPASFATSKFKSAAIKAYANRCSLSWDLLTIPCNLSLGFPISTSKFSPKRDWATMAALSFFYYFCHSFSCAGKNIYKSFSSGFWRSFPSRIKVYLLSWNPVLLAFCQAKVHLLPNAEKYGLFCYRFSDGCVE